MAVEIRRQLQALLDIKSGSMLEAHLIRYTEGLATSQAYQWVGLVYGTDELRRPSLNVYYLKRPASTAQQATDSREQNIALSEMREGFNKLSLAVRPEVTFLDYSLRGINSPEEAGEHLRRLCQTDPGKLELAEARMIFEKTLLIEQP